MCHGFKQHIQSLVFTDETKEQDHFIGVADAQEIPCGSRADFFSKIIIQRMGHCFGGFCLIEKPQVGQHFFAHGNKTINRFDEIFGKGFVAKTLFVRNDIVGNANHFGMPVLFYDAEYGAQAGPHQRQPVTHHDQVGLFFFKPAANGEPVERVDRVDADIYL